MLGWKRQVTLGETEAGNWRKLGAPALCQTQSPDLRVSFERMLDITLINSQNFQPSFKHLYMLRQFRHLLFLTEFPTFLCFPLTYWILSLSLRSPLFPENFSVKSFHHFMEKIEDTWPKLPQHLPYSSLRTAGVPPMSVQLLFGFISLSHPVSLLWVLVCFLRERVSFFFFTFLPARDIGTAPALPLQSTLVSCDFLPAEVPLIAVKYIFPMDYK